MSKLILASVSPRRKEILAKTGLRFGIIASNYKEDMNKKMPPFKLAEFISYKKAEAVARKCPHSVIIGADTFVVLGNKLLGKPHTPKEAVKMLRKINGKTLKVITGFTHAPVPRLRSGRCEVPRPLRVAEQGGRAPHLNPVW